MRINILGDNQAGILSDLSLTMAWTAASLGILKVVSDAMNFIPNELGDHLWTSFKERDFSELKNIDLLKEASEFLTTSNLARNALLGMLIYGATACALKHLILCETTTDRSKAFVIPLSTIYMLPIAEHFCLPIINIIPIQFLVYQFFNSIKWACQKVKNSHPDYKSFAWVPSTALLMTIFLNTPEKYSNPILFDKFTILTTAAAVSTTAIAINALYKWTSAKIAYLSSLYKPKFIRKFKKDNYEITVYQKGNSLQYIDYPTKGLSRLARVRLGGSIDEDIATIENPLTDVFLDRNTAPRFVDYQTTLSAPSQMVKLKYPQNNTYFDENNWLVSLYSTGPTWYGHSVIAIEGIHNGISFFHITHLEGGLICRDFETAVNAAFKTGIGNVVYHPIRKFDASRVKVIGGLWKVKRDDVEKMMLDIGKEIEFQNKGGAAVFFSYEGSSSIVSKKKSRWSDYKKCAVLPHNCLTWAREKLTILGINLKLSAFTNIAAVPNDEMRYIQ